MSAISAARPMPESVGISMIEPSTVTVELAAASPLSPSFTCRSTGTVAPTARPVASKVGLAPTSSPRVAAPPVSPNSASPSRSQA